MFPTLSTIQFDIPRVRAIYLRVLRVIALVTFPASLGLMAVADFFVLGLLGDEWIEVIPVLRVLCILGVTQSLGRTAGIIYQTTGRTDLHLRFTIYASVVTISSFIIGLNWGAFGVATSYVIATLVFLTYPGIKIVGSLIGMSFLDYARNIAGIFACSITMAGVVFCTGQLLQSVVPTSVGLFILVAIGVLVYSALIVGFRVLAFRDMRTLILEYVRNRRQTTSA